MSSTIDTVRTDERESPDHDGTAIPPAAWFSGEDSLDVTELSFERVAAYAGRADGDVYLERKAGKTLLIAD